MHVGNMLVTFAQQFLQKMFLFHFETPHLLKGFHFYYRLSTGNQQKTQKACQETTRSNGVMKTFNTPCVKLCVPC